MHKKEPQKAPEHTSEHVNSQNVLEACPQTPLPQWASHFVFALGPSNPLGGPPELGINFLAMQMQCVQYH